MRTEQIFEIGDGKDPWVFTIICPMCFKKFKARGAYCGREQEENSEIRAASAVFCSNACKQRAYRRRRALERNAKRNGKIEEDIKKIQIWTGIDKINDNT